MSFWNRLSDVAVRVHDFSVKNPKISYVLADAGVVYAWYSMPDFCRSRTLRFCGKATLLGVLAANDLHINGSVSRPFENDEDSADTQSSKMLFIATALGLGGVSLVGTVLFEKFIFRRGESHRVEGVRFAHTRQAVAIAALSAGALYVLPDEILLGKSVED